MLFEDGKEITTQGQYLCNIFTVSFDREKIIDIKKNVEADFLFRITYGWDRIESEIISYSLDVLCEKDSEAVSKIPAEVRDCPVSESVEVSKEEFMAFLRAHTDEFDILDNRVAQVPCLMFYDVPKEGE